MSKAVRSVEHFLNGYACSQAILVSYGPHYGLDEFDALRVSSGFAAGMRSGSVCGAVTGAYMVLGMHAADEDCDTGEGRAYVFGLVEAFNDRFKKKNGVLACRELLGCDICQENGLRFAKDQGLFKTKCPQLVRDAAEILEELLSD